MTRDEMLTGWLVLSRMQFWNDNRCVVPPAITDALKERGWIEVDDEPEFDGNHNVRITDLGCKVSDLAAADWGIDAVNTTESD
jgi:hypothetical protein